MLAKLGWSNTEKDIFMMDDLIKMFEINDVQRSGAVFDKERLNFINQNHMALKTDDELISLMATFNDNNGWHIDAEECLEALVRADIPQAREPQDVQEIIRNEIINLLQAR